LTATGHEQSVCAEGHDPMRSLFRRRFTMQMKQSERYACKQCGCEVTVTVAPSVMGKGGQGSLVCCGEKMSSQN